MKLFEHDELDVKDLELIDNNDANDVDMSDMLFAKKIEGDKKRGNIEPPYIVIDVRDAGTVSKITPKIIEAMADDKSDGVQYKVIFMTKTKVIETCSLEESKIKKVANVLNCMLFNNKANLTVNDGKKTYKLKGIDVSSVRLRI